MRETTPTVMTTDQARLVKAFDGDPTLVTPADLKADGRTLTSAATRLLLDGWAIRDEASK